MDQQSAFTISDSLMIIAVLLGPVLAVQVQKFIERRKEAQNRCLQLFRTLMATRGQPISPLHVEALNLIDIEFYSKKGKFSGILSAWRFYLDHLASYPQDNHPNYQMEFQSWASKNNDYLNDLLHEMSKTLGYAFDKVILKKGVYVPRGHSDLEYEQLLIRKNLIGVLSGNRPISIEIKNAGQQPSS